MQIFFLFIGREPTMLSANNCLQIMVCSYAMSSNCVRPQLYSAYPCERSCVKQQIATMTFHRAICDRTMKQLLNSEGNLIQYLLIFFSKNKSSRWLTCCLCFCLPLFQTDFTESHCPLYLQLFKRIKNRDQIQVRRRHFQLLQIDLNCKRSVITTIMIISRLL